MPVITIEMGQATEEKKTKLIKGLTEEASKITELGPEKFTVFIREYPFENIGQGGMPIKKFLGL